MKLGGPRALIGAVALGVCCSLGAAFSRAADASDANRTHAFVVGRSTALSSCAWLDASNSSRANVVFPRAPTIAFRARLSGGIAQAPASDAAGNLFVLQAEARLSKLDSRGRTLWTKRLERDVSSAPVVTTDGTLLLLTHEGQALFFAPSGAAIRQVWLPFGTNRHPSVTIPTANGGALVASGTELVELDAAGAVTRQMHAPANVTALAEAGVGLLAICENGVVSRARATGDLELLGNLGGAVPEGAAVQDGKLLAVVDAHKLVAFDLIRGQSVILASDLAGVLSGPPVLFGNRSLLVVVDGGFLSLRASSGKETLRLPVAEASRAFDPAARALRPALAIVDARGAVAATRTGSDAIILIPDGRTLRLDDTACVDPFRPTPTQNGVIFACRSGQLFGVGSAQK